MRVEGAQHGVAPLGRWTAKTVIFAFALILGLGLSGCRLRSAIVTPTPLPAGVYTNAQYHFSIHYPTGWQPTVTESGSTVAPLLVTITRSSDLAGHGSVVSTLTVAVFDAKNPTIAQSIAGLPTQAGLHTTTISGVVAYATAPNTQAAPGASIKVTHTEYYVVAGGYEYQLSTDAIQGDSADSALAQMLASFQITG